MEINIQNIEKIIFYDKKIWEHIPELKNFYNQWCLSQKALGMRDIGKRAVINFMEQLNDNHISKLEKYFGETILIDKIDHNILICMSLDKSAIEQTLCKYDNYKDFFITRNKNQVSICFWR
jgi:hypothetical protein